jgi:hypothetical protein
MWCLPLQAVVPLGVFELLNVVLFCFFERIPKSCDFVKLFCGVRIPAFLLVKALGVA